MGAAGCICILSSVVINICVPNPSTGKSRESTRLRVGRA